jgi:tryptophan-rich hypothetical protein
MKQLNSTTLSPKKLLNSKWTAVSPSKKEKHFLVTKVKYDLEGNVELCLIEAVMTKRAENIDWRELKDKSLWKPGWL